MDTLRKILWLVVTGIVATYHVGVAPRPALPSGHGTASFTPKEKLGIHQLILTGSPLQRGYEAGRLTKHLLLRQETELWDSLSRVLPWAPMRQGLFLVLMRWFSGTDAYVEPWMKAEMWGISQSTNAAFDSLSEPYTRQIAYHGLHEVGQMFVDFGAEACTVLATPTPEGWLIGRNFDFEGGPVFDEEKIMKWVFPDEGLAYLSIIWAGMVGAVSGVNERGVYVSINAAGTSDFRRLGTPSTLVAVKALQTAKTAEEAAAIIEGAEMFMTDLFVVADATHAFRIEKSPERVRRLPIVGPTAITNHLSHPDWAGDKVNEFRKQALTSTAREQSGRRVLADVRDERTMQAALRDKRDPSGKPLPPGHRSSIDALIASHSLVYHAGRRTLWVSRGPALVGPFLGFDLEKSFERREPVLIESLPPDPEVDFARYARVKKSLHLVAIAERVKDCDVAKKYLDAAHATGEFSYAYWAGIGRWHECRKETGQAKAAYEAALALSPAYRRERAALRAKVNP